jgi:hypothetical protein
LGGIRPAPQLRQLRRQRFTRLVQWRELFQNPFFELVREFTEVR